MVRTLTDPDSDDILEWTEKAMDADGDSLSTSLELDAIDDGTGFTQQDTDSSNVSWLDYSVRTNLKSDGTREVFYDITADSTQLTVGYTYRFEITADDGITTTTRTFTLEIVEGTTYGGTKLFIAGGGDDNFGRFGFGTNWDPTTLSQEQKVSYNNGSTDIHIKPDGTKIFITDTNPDDQFEAHTLSTAVDLTTGTQDGSFSVSTDPNGIFVTSDGTDIFVTDPAVSNQLQKYTMSTPWDITTASQQQAVSPSNTNDPGRIWVKPDGTMLWLTESYGAPLYEYTMGTAYDLSTLTYQTSITITNDIRGVAFRSDGAKMYLTNGNQEIVGFDLNTLWDITDRTLIGSTDVSGFDSGLRGICPY